MFVNNYIITNTQNINFKGFLAQRYIPTTTEISAVGDET